MGMGFVLRCLLACLLDALLPSCLLAASPLATLPPSLPRPHSQVLGIVSVYTGQSEILFMFIVLAPSSIITGE